MKKTLILSALVTILLDQLSKYWVVVGLGMGDRPPLYINEFFSFVMVWNHGVSFGMFSAPDSRLNAYILVALAAIISALLARVALKSVNRLETIAYGMIIGGALGNALDRIRLGAVADFLYFHYQQYGWPAFNIADSAICIGVGFLLLHLFKNSRVPA
jgi:signal peptidase II